MATYYYGDEMRRRAKKRERKGRTRRRPFLRSANADSGGLLSERYGMNGFNYSSSKDELCIDLIAIILLALMSDISHGEVCHTHISCYEESTEGNKFQFKYPPWTPHSVTSPTKCTHTDNEIASVLSFILSCHYVFASLLVHDHFCILGRLLRAASSSSSSALCCYNWKICEYSSHSHPSTN